MKMKFQYVVLVIFCLFLSVLYYNNTFLDNTLIRSSAVNIINDQNQLVTIVNPNITTVPDDTLTTLSSVSHSEYLVYSSKCKIPNYDPFNKEAMTYYKKENYKSCTSKKLLTEIEVINNKATLFLLESEISSYTSNEVFCCWSNITRSVVERDRDNKIKLSICKDFEKSTPIYSDPVSVKCVDNKIKRVIYENVHTAFLIDDNIQKKLDNFDNTTNTFSVLFLAIDSVSRLSLIRSLPNTYKFVEENGWIPLKGYNKVDDNTFPNVMAILTGYNGTRSASICNPNKVGKLNECPMLWYDFRNLGYVTAYAEDESYLSTFNNLKKGFSTPPTDYYFRPYIISTENLKITPHHNLRYCTGPETAGERIMNLAKQFAVTFKNYPNFGFFWMNSFSHNDINSPSGMDNKVKDFLEEITKQGVTKNSFVIFLSDHGMRYGASRHTLSGWLEERLPFIYVSIPDWFKNRFTEEYENFRINSNRLTSPYDLHMTLKHILVLSGRNFTLTRGEGCSTCKSLFEEADSERSCADAGIEQHWCTCNGFKKIILDKKVMKRLSEFAINSMHDIIRSKNKKPLCARYSMRNILATSISQDPANNDTYILFQFQTKPKAIFEITIRYVGDISVSNFSISGEISRLDSYDKHSKCVKDAHLKKYCYCSLFGARI